MTCALRVLMVANLAVAVACLVAGALFLAVTCALVAISTGVYLAKR